MYNNGNILQSYDRYGSFRYDIKYGGEYMASVTFPVPLAKPWVELLITANDTGVQLANGGAYLFVYVGNATQSEIFTVLVGSTGNTTYTTYGSNSALTITNGSGTGIITLKGTQQRYVYVMALNGVAPATLAT